jgi:deoxyribonuclease (pyrimidine dimer)
MMRSYILRYPEPKDIPDRYTLGTGHMRFFKNKARYLRRRHRLLKQEMKDRGFRPRKQFLLDSIPGELRGNWRPHRADLPIIKERIVLRLRKRPNRFYRYYGRYPDIDFLIDLVQRAARPDTPQSV